MKDALTVSKYEMPDSIWAWIYFLVGYGFICLFQGPSGSWFFPAYVVFYVLTVLGYLKAKGVAPHKESWFWLAVLLAAGIPFPFWSILQFLQFGGLLAAAAYWTLSASGSLLKEGKTSQWVAADFWNACFRLPFSYFTCQIQALFRRKPKGFGVFLGILLTLPVLGIILPLLSRADAGFEALLGGVLQYIRNNLMKTLWKLLLSLPVSLYLYGLVFGGVAERGTMEFRLTCLQEKGKRTRCIPNTAVCTVLIVLCLIYLLFIGMQGNYLFAAFANRLPEEFTYAEYARRGFFELCQIGAWNIVIVGGGGLLAKQQSQEHKLLRLLTVLSSVLTLLLIVTAMSKMGMYVGTYGLTVNRLLPMVFMIWLMLVFVSLIVRQKKEFPMMRICVIAGAVLFCLLCIFPWEDWIELYNTWAKMKGLIV